MDIKEMERRQAARQAYRGTVSARYAPLVSAADKAWRVMSVVAYYDNESADQAEEAGNALRDAVRAVETHRPGEPFEAEADGMGESRVPRFGRGR